MSFGLASRSVTSERSIQDSDFSLRAQQVMQTAMKLPPHILPTIDELDPNSNRVHRDKHIGNFSNKTENFSVYKHSKN